jgi:hypothetical protein
MTLRLEHATLEVPDLTEAGDILWDRFGLRITATPEDSEGHARLYLDRSYVEVVPGTSDADGLRLTGFYLSHPDVPSAIETLWERGLANGPAVTYRGVDGVWWDGVLTPPEGVPAPVIVQRTEPADVAADWPPALINRHPSGIERLLAVYLVTPYVAQAVEFYEQLSQTFAAWGGAFPARQLKSGGQHWALADQQWEVSLPGGGRVIICDAMRPGRARDLLIANGPCIAGLELGTGHLPDTEIRLNAGSVGYRLDPDEHGVAAWIDPEATPGILLVIRAGSQ